MADHLSALALDTAAAGLPLSQEQRAHLDACAECRAKVAALQTQAAQVLEHPRMAEVLRRPAEVRTLPRWAPAAISAALAATLLIVAGAQLFRPDDGTLLKG